MSFIFQLHPDATAWCVRLGDIELARLATFEAAERRARWLTARQAVSGHASELHVFDGDGQLVGRWVDELYLACSTPRPILAAA